MSVSAPDDAVSIDRRRGGAPVPPRPERARLHASCVAVEGWGVLLLGASGSGKSDLAARLIDGGGTLVADDQVVIARQDGALIAWPPEALAGLLEIRGLGILRLPFRTAVPLRMAVELGGCGELPRLPEPEPFPLLGLELPRILLDPMRPSAVAVVRLALRSERFA